MSTLLYVSASPKGASSDSRALAGAFLDTHRQAHPDVVVDEIDLFDGKLPAFGHLAAEAKMAVWGGGQPSAEQQGEWDAARAVFDRFAAADAYLFTVPMWNAGVPYALKQWIDIISQPGWLFSFTPDAGYSGLIRGKKAAVIYTSGVYQPGAPLTYGADFHAAFFNDWLRYAGFTDIAEIRWQPTVVTASRDADKAAALQRAAEAGRRF
jgi:FMN-dependent NADH-azoreductase